MERSAGRRRNVVAGAVVVAGLVGFLVVRPDPSLADRARQLHEVEPLAIEGVTLRSWTRDGLTLSAVYERPGVEGRFELTLWETDDAALDRFRREVEELTGEEFAGTDVLAGREPCFRDGPTSTCVGYDGNRTFRASATTTPGSEGELDARLLMRTARKHWYRVVGGRADPPS